MRIMMISSFIFLSLLSRVVQSFVKVNTATHGFADEYGRELVFHGINAVYKIFPWTPLTSGFDAFNSLSDIDAKNLRGWGFNIVRLGVMWPGVEPTQGSYNSTYLDEMEVIVNHLKDQNIYVILDFHQDLFHRKFCGEGVPDYVYDICKNAEDASTPPFPKPVGNATYPVDENGDPELDSCLSRGFFDYYMSAEVGAAYQCLYDNVDGLWDSFASYWKVIATRFKGYRNVLGYELFNEPWLGDNYADKKAMLPDYTEKNYLQPMYEYLHSAIRSIDDDHIIFFEGLTIDYWPNGFSSGPGGSDYNDRQALSYHIYCPIQNATAEKEVACDAINDEFFFMRRQDVKRIGGAMIMTEFGASKDVLGDLYALQKNCKQADKFSQSWIYWQFKYYQDITTCTPVGESLYNADGTVVDDKLKVLSRTYPQAVAGSNIEYSFDQVSAHFELSYNLLSALPENELASTTVVYFNRQYHYPFGAQIEVTLAGGEAPVEVACGKLLDEGFVYFKQTDVTDSTDPVSITMTPCTLREMSSCTCKF